MGGDVVRGRAAWATAAAFLALGGCGQDQAAAPTTKTDGPVAAAPAPPARPRRLAFARVDEAWGIKFRQVSGNSAEKHFPSANGSGVAMIDFDNDGRLDLYFATGRPMPFEPGSPGPRNALFRNRAGQPWADVGAASGLDFSMFTHGVLAADFDDDGFDDLAASRVGGTRLLRNNGDGTFALDPDFRDDRWGSSLAALDGDGDGRLDLYATHYGRWTLKTNPQCLPQFCAPGNITPREHALYQNLGGWAFRDRYVDWGLAKDNGRGQGVTACDLDDDGRPDLWVANDQCPNFVFLGQGPRGFKDHSMASGAAMTMNGSVFAGMGTDVGDVDRDGLPDLFVTNFEREYNALYLNQGRAIFRDASHEAGIAKGSGNSVNWGTRLADFDNDGWLDVLVVSGHVDDNIAEVRPEQGQRFRTPAQCWRNLGPAKAEKKLVQFEELPAAELGPFFAEPHCARGAAFGDLDNDGWVDFAVNNRDEDARVVRNASGELPANAGRKPWVRLRLVGRLGTRDAVSARVELLAKEFPAHNANHVGKGCIVEWVRSGGSYLSSSDRRVLAGIGAAAKVEVRIRWPSGAISTLEGVAAGSDLVVLEPLGP